MRDPRISQLAKQLVHYSVGVKQGDNVLIEMIGGERELVKALIEEIYQAGGNPYVELQDRNIRRVIISSASKAHIEEWAAHDLERMNKMNGWIGIRASENASDLSGIPSDKMAQYEQLYTKPVHLERRVKHTNWVIARFPNDAMAQMAGMNTDAFEQFYFNVCNLDYAKMSKAMDPLSERMSRTDKVRIVGPGTDLSFSIKGIGNVKCDGKRNIPDGELYTAPVRDSVNGVITYNTPSVHLGVTYENICFRFENGKIVEATANDTERLNAVLDTDEGARYIGEFSLGFNPYILHPMKDTLFDEKIAGSLHFTPGQAYEEADNGNRSAVHWDLVLIQRPEYGGGEVWFDDELIRKDGLFVVPDLKGLNPDQLK
ncbi:aminopeptidase [Paenibacillus turpanensis]|uniref:aminopeptidase n=1 Tax=Paenibacillus turpanensis TaxID=2689078 RepID=UPI00140E6A18|nr:aminopeptidase [Paenibacillus turpanensis]